MCLRVIPMFATCAVNAAHTGLFHFLQVEQILNLRTDLMEAAEKLRRSEADRQQLDTDIVSLRQQVRRCWQIDAL